jgi:hypothetical protein
MQNISACLRNTVKAPLLPHKIFCLLTIIEELQYFNTNLVICVWAFYKHIMQVAAAAKPAASSDP